MITIDTSALVAGIDSTDPDHDQILAVSAEHPGSIILPVPILTEATYLIDRVLGSRLVEFFLSSIIEGDFILDCCDEDLPRALTLVARYRDMPLGFADAAVIACAERHGGKVLTLDRRHFGVVEKEGTIQVLP